MYVQSLKVSGFMSFEDVTWKPERLNVLIGPNGSGKSNMLRFLELIRASAAGTLGDFVIRKGGLPRLLWGGSAQQIEFQITADSIPGQPSNARHQYRVLLATVPHSASFRIEQESLTFSDQSAPAFLRDRDTLRVGGADDALAPGQAKRLPDTETFLSSVSLWSPPVEYDLQQQLRACAIHHDLRVDEHAEIRRPAVLRTEQRISPDGQNLTPVLKTLYEGNFRDAIDSGMSAAFPDDYAELFFRQTEPDRTQVYVRRKHSDREDSAAELSDGTLRFLLLLTILA